MKMKRLVYLVFVCVLSSVLCSGCADIRQQVEQALWDHSGINEDDDYRRYQDLAASGQLREDGTYYSEAVENYLAEQAKEPDGSILVSFARNDSIRIDYYEDAALSKKITGGSLWMDPGDTIYASAPVLNSPNSSLYQFSHFQIWTHDAAGKLKSLEAPLNELPGIAYRIPEDFTGTELSILPLGEYRNRTVTFQGGTIRADGTFEILDNGFWELNGKRYGNVSVELKALESYRIVYDYSAYKDGWYFVESTPAPYWDKVSEGTITFLTDSGDEENVSYTVLLHPYGNMIIRNAVSYQNPLDSIWDSASSMFTNRSVIETQNILELIQVNGISVINNFSDTEVVVPQLKVGDELLIRVPAELKLIGEGLSLPQGELIGGKREYRFLIPDTDSMIFTIDVSRRNMESDEVFHEYTLTHGTLSIYDNLGMRYSEGSELPAPDERITVEIIPEDEYCVYGKNVKNNVYRAEMKYSDFCDKYDRIIADHPIRPGIIVTLDTEDDLGECVFWTGNEMLSGRVVLREGQDLQFDYLLRNDSGYEITLTPEERAEIINVWSPYAATRELDVTEEMNGKTLRCRDFVTLKEGVTYDYDIENNL